MARSAFLLPALLLPGLLCCAAPAAEPSVYLTSRAAREHWLVPVVDGRTTRDELRAAYGEPTSFEGGRLLAYRLLLVADPAPLDDDRYDDLLYDIEVRYEAPLNRRSTIDFDAIREHREELLAAGSLLAVPPGPPEGLRRHLVVREAEYHLVAACDAQGTVLRHALVRVGP